ncbi:MAG: heat-inducible transcriptional repressor HrcA [bacterium]|nr:heat-inducible transcription repressor HrcA [Gammaproteobacteria bacterium]HIL95432.1 heat-inducible transcription repressor HrcA [Pseudomonadales bacterium]
MSDNQKVSPKGQILLKSLVETYIAEGQPVGSKTLSQSSDLSVSPATIRNVMADLEEKGYVSSPHTSAGRIPTALGYRFFVDSLLTVEPLDSIGIDRLTRQLDPDMTAHELVESASGMLSEVTHLAGVVTVPRREQIMLRHVEFLGLNDNRVLVILVLDDHEVQNRVIYTKEQYTEIQLKEASNFVNQSFVGQSMSRIRDHLISSMQKDRQNMNSLMQTTLEMAEKAFGHEEENDYVVAGQENLFDISQDNALADIRELFKAFSLKGDILHLLDRCMESNGMQLFIGQESGYEILDECSVVASPYHVEGELVGVLGVIGPTRMAYDRVIPIVNATARILSAALDGVRSKPG